MRKNHRKVLPIHKPFSTSAKHFMNFSVLLNRVMSSMGVWVFIKGMGATVPFLIIVEFLRFYESNNEWMIPNNPIFPRIGAYVRHLEPAMVNSCPSDFSWSVRKVSKMAVEVAPLRTLQDFITDAQFTAPTLHDRDRMDNRMINNLIYYQTNYFLSAIIIFILVG